MFLRLLPLNQRIISAACRRFGTTSLCSAKKIVEKTDGNVTVIEVESVAEPQKPKLELGEHSCALCALPVKIKYTDVLILEQFMREDGTVLPKQITGICAKQQYRLERCVMQAHWAGLFPDKTLPDFDRAGYKRFNRYWDDDWDMYKTEIKVKPGSWFYVHQHLPRAPLYNNIKRNFNKTKDTSTS
uniref:Mitochondrial ribosomal protein S18A n=1 Tax=Panagrolaimus sp. PS1159 TaxID=55785 RepID=A0AC35FBR7_9BILA